MTRRILHLISSLDHGGAEHQLLLYTQGLDRSRFESHVCHMVPKAALAEEFTRGGVPVHSIATAGPLKSLRMLRKLMRTVRANKIDLIHTVNSDAGVLGGLAGKLLGVPVVTTLTNAGHEEAWLIDNPHLNGFKLGVSRRYRQFVLRTFHSHYIAVSRYVAATYERRFKLRRDRIRLIYRSFPPGFDSAPALSRAEIRRSLAAEDAEPLLLSVGRLVPQKGQRYAIMAMPEILRQYPKARLLIAGQGYFKKQLEGLAAELKLKDAVTFLGVRTDIRALHEAADIFVFPSLTEGCPGALIEAMAAGKPCVSSSAGPMPEIIENDRNGLLVAWQSPAEIAAAVVSLAKDRMKAERLGAAARASVRERFTLDIAIREMETFYESVLSGKASVPAAVA